MLVLLRSHNTCTGKMNDRNTHSCLYLQVSGLSWLLVIPKYCGFSMTGIFVIPMMTASGPPSEEDGVLLPFEMWWRGLAESSSLLMTEEGPRVRNKDFLVTQCMVLFCQMSNFFFFFNFNQLSSIPIVNSSLCVPCWPYLRNFVRLGADGEQWSFFH